MSRLALPVEILVFRHIDLTLSNVLLDQISVFLRILTVEGIPLRRDVVKAAAKRPDVRFRRQLGI